MSAGVSREPQFLSAHEARSSLSSPAGRHDLDPSASLFSIALLCGRTALGADDCLERATKHNGSGARANRAQTPQFRCRRRGSARAPPPRARISVSSHQLTPPSHPATARHLLAVSPTADASGHLPRPPPCAASVDHAHGPEPCRCRVLRCPTDSRVVLANTKSTRLVSFGDPLEPSGAGNA